jgi:predicted nucleic acid-binding protein
MSIRRPSAHRLATVALDASVLINILILNRVAILAGLPGYRFVVLDAVEQEIQRQEQQVILADAFDENLIGRAGTATPQELAIFAEHRKVMGLGEAACLAAAEHRGWLLASDERGVFRRIACERIGESRILTTPSILSRAVKTGVISVGELRDAKTKLERNRFRMRPGAFDDLFSE